MLNVGDKVGMLRKVKKVDESEEWTLLTGKINKITNTKKYGRRYFTNIFYPLDADSVDLNTEDMEEAAKGKTYILTKEVFGLNDDTRPYAEQWIEWANKNPNKAVSIFCDFMESGVCQDEMMSKWQIIYTTDQIKEAKRNVQKYMRKHGSDEDFIENISDDFVMGFMISQGMAWSDYDNGIRPCYHNN